jgi:plasmid stability protein
MAQLLVREVDEELVAALKRRAAAHGRSAESEHRLILDESLRSPQPKKRSFKEVLASMPYFDDDDLFAVR